MALCCHVHAVPLGINPGPFEVNGKACLDFTGVRILLSGILTAILAASLHLQAKGENQSTGSKPHLSRDNIVAYMRLLNLACKAPGISGEENL